MASEAPTNNYITDMVSKNVTIQEALTLPFKILGGSSYSSCIPSGPTNWIPGGTAIVDRMQQTLDSIDLSVSIPNHPKVTFFGDYYSIESNAFSGEYAVDLPRMQTLVDVQLGIAISTLFGVLFATILYRTFHQKQTKPSQPSPLQKALTGSALFLTAILLPYAIIDMMGNKSSAVRFTICLNFFLYIFRIMEAIFGFIPIGAMSSWSVYCVYFALPFDMIFENKNDSSRPVRCTKRDIWDSQVALVKNVTFIIGLCSVLTVYDYKPFGDTNAGEFHERIVLRDYLGVRHLGNGFAIAFIFQQFLALGSAATTSIIQLTLGYKVKQMMHNPMLEATSPSDFWGRRWNVLVHAVMKRGVYKPVRKYSRSPVLASLAVFVASGVLHEWLVHVVLMYHRECTSGKVLLGSNTAFFVWNFCVIVAEKVLSGSRSIQSFGKMIPSLFVPFIIIMSALPMAHWFGNPYMNGDFFSDYEACLPILRKV